MKLARDLSVLFAVLIAMAMVTFGTFEYRETGILLLWLALLVLVFLLLAVVSEVERLQARIDELENPLAGNGEHEL